MTFLKKISVYAAVLAGVLAIPAAAFAQGAADAPSNQNDANSMLGLSAAIAIGIAAFAGTYSQGRATSAALEGIARQPNAADKIQTPMILGLALIESLVLFAFVIAYLLLGKIQVGA